MNFVRPKTGASTGHAFPAMPATPIYWIKKLFFFENNRYHQSCLSLSTFYCQISFKIQVNCQNKFIFSCLVKMEKKIETVRNECRPLVQKQREIRRILLVMSKIKQAMSFFNIILRLRKVEYQNKAAASYVFSGFIQNQQLLNIPNFNFDFYCCFIVKLKTLKAIIIGYGNNYFHINL